MKIFIAVPCLDHLDTEFVNSLCRLNKPGITDVYFQQSSLVYDSRNILAQNAVDNESDYVLWLDSDVTFNADMLIDMLKDIKELKCDVVSSLYFARRPDFEPTVWTKLRSGETPEEEILEKPTEFGNEPFEIDACGFGAVLMKTEVLKAVIEKYNLPFSPFLRYGEDISFCIRARRLGYVFMCDPRIRLGHMARTVVTEETYKAWKARAGELNGNT